MVGGMLMKKVKRAYVVILLISRERGGDASPLRFRVMAMDRSNAIVAAVVAAFNQGFRHPNAGPIIVEGDECGECGKDVETVCWAVGDAWNSKRELLEPFCEGREPIRICAACERTRERGMR